MEEHCNNYKELENSLQIPENLSLNPKSQQFHFSQPRNNHPALRKVYEKIP